VSFHDDGTLVLYPIAEREPQARAPADIIDAVVQRLDFKVSHLIGSHAPRETGKVSRGHRELVLDHIERVAYACTSPRTHPQLVADGRGSSSTGRDL